MATTAELIHAGFAARATFNGSPVSCTGFSIASSTNLLESGGGYGGKLNDPDKRGVHSPFILDLTNISGSLTYEPTVNQIKNLVEWIDDRGNYRPMTYQRGADTLNFDKCFLQSFTLSAAEGGIVSADANLWMYKTKYWGGTLGGATGEDNIGTPIFTGAFDVDDDDTGPVPYWYTGVEFKPGGAEDVKMDVISWSCTISQSLVNKMYTKPPAHVEMPTDGSAPLPGAVMVGPLMADLSMDVIIAKNKLDFEDIFQMGDDDETEVNIKIGGKDGKNILKFKRMVVGSIDPTLDDAAGANSVSLSYKAYSVKTKD